MTRGSHLPSCSPGTRRRSRPRTRVADESGSVGQARRRLCVSHSVTFPLARANGLGHCATCVATPSVSRLSPAGGSGWVHGSACETPVDDASPGSGPFRAAVGRLVTVTTSRSAEELLERAEALTALDALLADVRSSMQGRLVLVAGEAGVGKTALLRVFSEAQRPKCEFCGGRVRPCARRARSDPSSMWRRWSAASSATWSLARRVRTRWQSRYSLSSAADARPCSCSRTRTGRMRPRSMC